MKKYLILTIVLLVSGSVVSAQSVNVGTVTTVGVSVGQGANASSSAGTNASVKTSATATAATTKNNPQATTSQGSVVSLEAKTIRGWSDKEKSDFLLTVKTYAQLQSGQDLENFAKGLMASDANVSAVETEDAEVKVSYKLPAKFLGIFKAEIDATTEVTFETSGNGKGPKEVTVKFPWYRAFYSLDSEAQADVLENAIEASVEADAGVNGSANISARNGRTIQLISNILKAIRANVEANAEVEVD